MLYKYFLLFMIYSFIGWLGEIALSIIMNKKIVNRGFLMGPYCPIYGIGCLLLITILSKYQNDYIVLFVLSIVICSILEYFTSWILEVIFKLRWWDYKNFKYNINGRICLETMIPFGIFALIIIKFVNPFFMSLINKLNEHTLCIISIVLLIIFVIDLIISSNVIFNFKNIINDSKKDATEDLKKLIKKKMKDNKALYNRLINAFPNLHKITKNKRN